MDTPFLGLYPRVTRDVLRPTRGAVHCEVPVIRR